MNMTADLDSWDCIESFTAVEAAFLWFGLEPTTDTLPRNENELPKKIRALAEQIKDKFNLGYPRREYAASNNGMVSTQKPYKVDRTSLISYAKSIKQNPPFLFLEMRVPAPKNELKDRTHKNELNWRNDFHLLKSEKQDRAILAVIAMKGWNPLSVPDGEKGTISTLCETECKYSVNPSNLLKFYPSLSIHVTSIFIAICVINIAHDRANITTDPYRTESWLLSGAAG